MTYIPVGEGAGERAVGGKIVGGKLKACMVMWVMRGAINEEYYAIKYNMQYSE